MLLTHFHIFHIYQANIIRQIKFLMVGKYHPTKWRFVRKVKLRNFIFLLFLMSLCIKAYLLCIKECNTIAFLSRQAVKQNLIIQFKFPYFFLYTLIAPMSHIFIKQPLYINKLSQSYIQIFSTHPKKEDIFLKNQVCLKNVTENLETMNCYHRLNY